MDSFSFTSSGKHYIGLSILDDSFARQSNLGCGFLLFIILNTSCQSLLACKVSFEKSAGSLMETPLLETPCFFLAAFKILSLSLNFGILIMMCLRPLSVHLVWASLCFLDLCIFFLHQLRRVFSHYFFKQVPKTLLSLFSSGTPMM